MYRILADAAPDCGWSWGVVGLIGLIILNYAIFSSLGNWLSGHQQSQLETKIWLIIAVIAILLLIFG